MVPRLEEIDPIGAYRINQPMLLGNAARPGSGQNVFQRFRLADAVERLPHYGLHQVHNPERHPAIRLGPVAQVLAKFGMKDRQALRLLCQARTRAATYR